MKTKFSLKMVKENGTSLTEEERLSVLSLYSNDEIMRELRKRGFTGELKNDKQKDILTIIF